MLAVPARVHKRRLAPDWPPCAILPAMARYVESTARTILRVGKHTDSWFLSRCGMNLYRGCEHACAYCDGRAERYHVPGEFGREIRVKTNAPELLRKELAKIDEPVFVFLGGGVSDAYQPAEERYLLARRALELIRDRGLPVHVLTKSALVERDLDLLREINRRAGAIVSFSFSTADQELAEVFEPGCAPVDERFRLLERCRRIGLGAGVMLMPVLPYLSDGAEQIDGLLARARAAEVDFVLFGGLTLKPGRQREHYYQVLEGHDPALADRYREIYGANKWGNAAGGYYAAIEQRFARTTLTHRLAPRIPHRLFRDRVDLPTEVSLVLRHIGYLLRLRGVERRAYGYAGRRVTELGAELPALVEGGRLAEQPGIGEVTARLITELVRERRCGYYEHLMAGDDR